MLSSSKHQGQQLLDRETVEVPWSEYHGVIDVMIGRVDLFTNPRNKVLVFTEFRTR